MNWISFACYPVNPVHPVKDSFVVFVVSLWFNF